MICIKEGKALKNIRNKAMGILLFALILLASYIGVLQPAEIAANAGTAPVLTAGNVSGAAGDVIQVPVTLTSSGEVTGLQFDLSYDHTQLIYQQTSAGSLASGFSVITNPVGDNLRVIIYNGSNTPVPGGSGTVAQLQFQVAAGVQAGQTSALGLSGVILSDAQGQSVAATVNNGQFSVPQPADTMDPTWPDGSTLTAGSVTSTGLTLTWTQATDDTGVTSYAIYRDGTKIGTVDGALYSYSVTGLSANTSYTFTVRAGDAAGNWSTAGPGTGATTLVASAGLTPVSAATDHLGKEVILQFDRAMADPSGTQNQFTVNNGTTSDPVTGVALGANTDQIVLFLANSVSSAATVTLSYAPGTVTAADGSELQSLTVQAVTNNVLPVSSSMVGFDGNAVETSYDATGAVLKYRYVDPVDYDNVQLAWYFTNGFANPMVSNLNSYVKIYEKDSGAPVTLPNLMTQPNTPKTYNGPLAAYYGQTINEQVVTDWYFWQIGGNSPLGLDLVSRALKPSTTYIVEIDKGFTFNSGKSTATTYTFEFTTTATSQYAPSWADGSSLTVSNLGDTSLTLSWPAAQDNHGVAYNDTYSGQYIPNISYNIYQNGTLLATVDGKATSYDVCRLSPDSSYNFKVEATDFANNHSLTDLQTTAKTNEQSPAVPITSPIVTIDESGSNRNLAVTASTPSFQLTVPASVSNATLDLSSLLNTSGVTTATSALPAMDIAAYTGISSSAVVVRVPAGTTISAPASSNWDGTINVPAVQPNNTVTVTPDTGKTATVNAVIEVGFGDVQLTFSNAVRILIPGQAGKDAGYYRNGTFTKITNVLTSDSQDVGDALEPGTDGKIDVDNDLVIWTKHFTGFVTYTQTAASSGGDSGGSHSGGSDTRSPEWPDNAAVTVSRNQTEATLTWPAATDNVGVVNYRIKRDGVVLGSVDGSTTTYTDTGLQQGTNTYVWSVEAVDAAGNWSTAITGQGLSGQNPLSFVAASSTLTTVNGDNSTDDGPIEGSTTVPVNPTVRLYFDRGVTTDAVWSNNQQCLTMQDSTGTKVPINVFKLDSTTINDNLHYIFITPKSNLTSGKTYKIIISKNLTANNGHTLGENNGNTNEVVTFTVAASSGSPTSGGSGISVTTNGPTYTNGSASVDPAVGATVGLGDLARVVIPANALQETGSVTVDIKKVTSPPEIPAGFKAVSDVYEFSVGDKTAYSFAEKVALTFEFDASQIGSDGVPAVFYYDESQAKWVNIGGTVSGSTITVEVEHFTKYAVFAVPKAATPVVTPTQETLNDIEGHWAQNNIEKLVALGAVSGYPDGSFKPDGTITRAEFATILVKAFKLTPKSGKVFADTAGHWAEDNIATAAANGVLSGYDDNTFGPDDLITREQMAIMVVKAARLTMISEGTSFADNSGISEWAKGAVATVVKNGLMKGYPDNTFQPLGSATRAEAVTVIVNAL
ncbi:Cellulosome-anchoring protein precursor [Pelotomaculum schinkii]|uniref:Cellulosome-anchoring protein n=1 Tax=Pelotomaculum schinkii TaxID=78350 RepID=A0A4Y7RAD1_9FIRM|nr:Cellulosome-anchoring protein precursor [Pelotomaculum schinkii]TEB14840.1 Cellulosome-anchoring protein precursor [Pelotomaculum sp. FP]